MRLLFKQRLFSWFDSYDIYTEDGSVCYTVKGQLAWGHLLKVYDAQGREVGEVRERLLSLLPKMCIRDRVKKTLEAIPGVAAAEVSHEAGTAIVTLDAPVENDTLKSAVEAQDYKVTDIA